MNDIKEKSENPSNSTFSLETAKCFVVWMEQAVLGDFGIHFEQQSDDLMILVNREDVKLVCSSGKLEDLHQVGRSEIIKAIKKYGLEWEQREDENTD